MKQAQLIIFFITFSITSFAQIGFGPEFGIGISSMHFEPSPLYTSASSGSIFSGKVGGVVDIPLSKKFYLQTGLYFTSKGDVRNFSYTTNDSFNELVNQSLYVYYLDAPLNVIFKTSMQGKGRFFFGFGVIPGYIIGGINSIHAYGVFNGIKYDTSSSTLISQGKPLAGFDIGLNITVGYEMASGWFIKAYYTSGVNDIGLGGEVDKNLMWGLSFGYYFGKGRNINKDPDNLIDHTDGN